MAEAPTTPVLTDAQALTSSDIEGLAAALRGRLVHPDHPDYDEVRAVWNGMIDRRPALVAQCAGVADVMTAVRFARDHDLVVAVRGGGHNVSGNAVCDGGLVIDLSPMRGVQVDPKARTVVAQGGVTIGDLDHETQAFGLAVPMGVVTETGIAGLTLGGGLGWLRRKYGLSCDDLLSAQVVTADGTLVTAGEHGDPELLWGLCGGGGNFGVVTSFEFQAHPVGPDIFAVVTVHAAEDVTAALRAFREWAPAAPDEISAFAVLWHVPEVDEMPAEHHGTPCAFFIAMYSGDPADGESALQSLRDIGRPIADLSGVMPYLEMQQFFDEDYPAHEMRYYWKSRYLAALSDNAIDTLVALNEATPSKHSTLDIWQLGGALSRRRPEETAFGDRSAPYLIGIESNWVSPEDDAAGLAWGRQAYEALAPFSTGGVYVNFPGLYEDGDRMIEDTFGPNLERLATLKKRYDPTNLFRLNHNIRPA